MTHDIVIVGGGTAGLVTAVGAAALGAKAALVEREALGGDCLWTGCVPSKALIAFARQQRVALKDSLTVAGNGQRETWAEAVAWLKSAQARIARHDDPARFRGLGIDVAFGTARLVGPGRVDVDGRLLTAKRVVLATGAAPTVPPVEGLEAAGYLTHRTAFEQETLPPSLLIIGGGPIGLEFAQAYARLGAKVTVVEFLPEVLPREDPDAARLIRERLTAEGICVRTGFQVARVAREDGAKIADGAAGERFAAAELFVATGRRPDLGGLEPERAGVELDRGAVRVDARLRTTQRGIWAAGDVTGGPQFTHAAEYMARVVVQNALTPIPTKVDYRLVPRVTFTDPEVAAVGLTAEEAVAAGLRHEVHRYDFRDLDRAITEGAGADVGFCRVVATASGKILGATVVARGAGELLMPLVLAMRHGIPLSKLANAIYPYPTMSEIVKRTAQGWYRARYGDTWRGRLLRRVVRWWL